MAEVQRIVTCESTSTAHEAVLRKERHDMLSGDSAAAAAAAAVAPAAGGNDDDDDSDPDALVLYLVKWRGLPYDQCSWEHFKDIRFASDQILDFWDFCLPRPEVNNKKTGMTLLWRENNRARIGLRGCDAGGIMISPPRVIVSCIGLSTLLLRFVFPRPLIRRVACSNLGEQTPSSGCARCCTVTLLYVDMHWPALVCIHAKSPSFVPLRGLLPA